MREQNCSRQVLLIDPDEVFCQILQQVLGTGYRLRRVATAKAGASQLNTTEFDVVLLNLDLHNGAASNNDILGLVSMGSEQEFAPPMIVYGWDTRRKKAIEGFRPGGVDFLEQPLDVRALKLRLDAACRRADLTRDLGAARRMLSSNRVAGLPEEFLEGSFHESVRAFKRELVRSALRTHSGNKLQAARKLGISRCYLHRLLNQLNIAPVAPEEDSKETESRSVSV